MSLTKKQSLFLAAILWAARCMCTCSLTRAEMLQRSRLRMLHLGCQPPALYLQATATVGGADPAPVKDSRQSAYADAAFGQH